MVLRTPKYGKLWGNLVRYDEWYARMDPYLGRHKAEEFKKLINLWTSGLRGKKILKTDLREEAFGEDEILLSLTNEPQIYGLDIDPKTVQEAKKRQAIKKLNHNYIVADVRQIPFAENTFDLILSTSTLDHFEANEDLVKSLAELQRVMKPGAAMILLMNNKRNLNICLMFTLEKLLGLTAYPVRYYSLGQLRKIVTNVGLSVQEEDVTVHIISPLNTLLKIGRKIFPEKRMNNAALVCVKFARWLSKRRTKTLTGWFLALKLRKREG